VKMIFWMKWMIALIPIAILLQGCAHSAAQREAASQVDVGYVNWVGSKGGGSLSNTYQNTSQATKGAIIGGAGGAVAGGFTSGVGVLPGAAGGAILGGALGSYFDYYTTNADKLENRHVKVFVLGDQIMIVIPSEHLFNGQTAYIYPNAYSTLDLVADLIDSYPNMSVRVAAYTEACMPPKVALALTRQQANNVVKYLWRTEANTRMIYAEGGGRAHFVSPPNSGHAGENNRVEITLEKLPL
jgi:outer membrane protein OmpA-like peptidoglycan-associated protein